MNEWLYERLGDYWVNGESQVVIYGEDMPRELNPLTSRVELP